MLNLQRPIFIFLNCFCRMHMAMGDEKLKGKTVFKLERKLKFSKNKSLTKINICYLETQNLFQLLFKIHLQLQ